MVTKNRWLFLQKGSIVEVQLGSKYSCSINHQVSPIFNNSGILIYSRTIKVNESYGILHCLGSADLSKRFSQLIVSIMIFSQHFFNTYCPADWYGLPHIAQIMLTLMFFVFKTVKTLQSFISLTSILST